MKWLLVGASLVAVIWVISARSHVASVAQPSQGPSPQYVTTQHYQQDQQRQFVQQDNQRYQDQLNPPAPPLQRPSLQEQLRQQGGG